jgi:hypothetical protein
MPMSRAFDLRRYDHNPPVTRTTIHLDVANKLAKNFAQMKGGSFGIVGPLLACPPAGLAGQAAGGG